MLSGYVKVLFFADFRFVPTAQWIFPEHKGFSGRTKTVASLFRGIFSELNFDDNPSFTEESIPPEESIPWN
jgi:hypothetical protein